MRRGQDLSGAATAPGNLGGEGGQAPGQARLLGGRSEMCLGSEDRGQGLSIGLQSGEFTILSTSPRPWGGGGLRLSPPSPLRTGSLSPGFSIQIPGGPILSFPWPFDLWL